MTSNGLVPIGDARRISRERNCPIVVVFAIEPSRERFTVTTYGATKALCRVAADYGSQFAEAVMGARVSPSAEEPTHLPDDPTIWTPTPAPAPSRGPRSAE